jgi:hypothetical protein
MAPAHIFERFEPSDDEARLRQQTHTLPEFQLAEAATSVLAVVIDRTAESTTQQSEPLRSDPEALIRATVLATAIRAYRAARAGIIIVTSGYELEADAMTRLVTELYVQGRRIVDDPSGEEAREWLGLKRRHGIGKRIKEAAGADLYGALSVAAHGDPRGLRQLLGSGTAGDTVAQWGPRHSGRHQTVLNQFSIAARDMAVLLEECTGRQHKELELIDRGLQKLVPGWPLSGPATGGSGP